MRCIRRRKLDEIWKSYVIDITEGRANGEANTLGYQHMMGCARKFAVKWGYSISDLEQ